ncbi:MAG: tetratricopeptide repeat protein [Gammaproteobacteria bacterium]|nr:tetratricopeptide repeat protein [Gammaproteobacteria bacterium]
MNLFARILSHGFALIVVALLAIGLVYRGELFPDMELPAFLAFDQTQEDAADDQTDTGSRDGPDQAAAADAERAAGGPVTDTAISPQPIEAPRRDAPAGDTAEDEAVPATRADTGVLPGTVARDMDEAAVAADTVGDAVSTAADTAATTADKAAETGIAMPAADMAGAQEDMVSTAADKAAITADKAAETGIAMPAADTQDDMVSTAADTAATTADRAAEAAVAAPAAVGAPTTDTVEVPGLSPSVDIAGQGAGETADIAVERPARADTGAVPAAEDTAVPDAMVSAEEEQSMLPPLAAAAPAVDEPVSTYRLLAAAREAYWLRDYATAEQKYQAMIELDPNNPDGYGELGNMYFSQGKWDLASASYFEAGKRLADEGLLTEAQQLVDVLKGLQGPQADELAQYIADKKPAVQ